MKAHLEVTVKMVKAALLRSPHRAKAGVSMLHSLLFMGCCLPCIVVRVDGKICPYQRIIFCSFLHLPFSVFDTQSLTFAENWIVILNCNDIDSGGILISILKHVTFYSLARI